MSDQTPEAPVLRAEPTEKVTVVADAADATVHAHVEDGRVVNVVLAHPDVAGERGWIEIEHLDPRPGIGWTTDGRTFEPPAQPEPDEADENQDDEPAE